jgi:hypothetical protein
MASETAPSRLGTCLCAILLLQGCTFGPLFSGEAGDAAHVPGDRLQVQREKGFQQLWRGRPFKDLIANFGTPKMMMDVPGNRPLKTIVAVYGIRDKASNCIDAFTLVLVRRDELEVADYFCR